MVNKAVFFDKDGVLNHMASHEGRLTAPWTLAEFKYIDGAAEAVSLVKKLGFYAFVITNQPDVNDRKMTKRNLNKMLSMIQRDMEVDLIVCALKRNSILYKPNNGMIELIAGTYELDLSQCYLIGDSWKDIVCGYVSGVTTIFVGPNYTPPEQYQTVLPDYRAKDVLEACTIIEEIECHDQAIRRRS